MSPRECHPASSTRATPGPAPPRARHGEKPLPSISSSRGTELGRAPPGVGTRGSKEQPLRLVTFQRWPGRGRVRPPPPLPVLRRQSPDVIPRCKHRIPPLPSASRVQDCTKSFVHKDSGTLCRFTKQLSLWERGRCLLQPVAVPVAERGLRELYHCGAGFIEELWSPAQQPLGLGESLCQLFFPLNKLGVALQETQKQFGTSCYAANSVSSLRQHFREVYFNYPKE